MLSILPAVLLAAFDLACFLFIFSLIFKRNDIADVAWGPGIVFLTIIGAIQSGIPLGLPHYLMFGLMSLWAVRLSLRIYIKNRTKPEDPRYRVWRETWGSWFYPRSFLQVYLLQCFLMTVLASSALVAVLSPAPAFMTSLLIIGTLVWLIGFLFETVGDYQLDTFLKNPANKGKLLNIGLWRYTRHPNYFGEITMWWGLWVMTLSLPGMLIGLLSPVVITILIMFVSGVPLLEAMMSKHPDWAEYKRKTSVIIPWWPKA